MSDGIESDREFRESPDEQPVKEGRRTPSRALLNFWLDAVLFVSVVVIAWVSAVTYVVFPAPTSADGWTLWGMTFDQWHDIQATALCVCGLLAVEHLVLHWNWVCSIIATKVVRTKNRPDEASQAVYGVGTFIVILLAVVGSIMVASLTIKRPH